MKIDQMQGSDSLRTEPPYQTVRIWRRTVAKLRILHAITGESMVNILDDLVDRELKRQQKQGSLDAVLNDDSGNG